MRKQRKAASYDFYNFYFLACVYRVIKQYGELEMTIVLGVLIYFALGVVWLFKSDVRKVLWLPTQADTETINLGKRIVEAVDRVSDFSQIKLMRIYIVVVGGYFFVWPVVIYEHVLAQWISNGFDSIKNSLGIYDDSRFSARLEDLVQNYPIQEFGKLFFFSPPVKIRIKPKDEIWSYERQQGGSENLSGSMGLVLVRKGKIIGQLETRIS